MKSNIMWPIPFSTNMMWPIPFLPNMMCPIPFFYQPYGHGIEHNEANPIFYEHDVADPMSMKPNMMWPIPFSIDPLAIKPNTVSQSMHENEMDAPHQQGRSASHQPSIRPNQPKLTDTKKNTLHY